MKKLRYYTEDTAEWNNIYTDFGDEFPGLLCTYIMQTGGNPIADVEQEEIEDIQRVLDEFDGDGYEWEPCDEEDYEYVREWARIWGVDC